MRVTLFFLDYFTTHLTFLVDSIPAVYPSRITVRNPRLLPLAVRALQDLRIDRGQAAPKQISISVSSR